MTTTLKRLSVCKCGFHTLDEAIPLGTIYEIEPSIRALYSLTCGGCKNTFQVDTVWVYPRSTSQGGYMPAQIFEPSN